MKQDRLKVAIFGGRGRMGQVLRAALDDHERLEPWAVFEQGSPMSLLEGCEVAIDFTAPDASARHAEEVAKRGIPIVIGTTGLGAAQEVAVARAAEAVPVVYAANMSIGINLLAALVEQAAARLGPDYDIEIAELHHRMKVDAPSGTALMLGHAAAKGRSGALSDLRLPPRNGHTGPREDGRIGFSSLRGGDVAGEHTVYFFGEAERLELTHRATDRAIFARGALRAAEWVVGQAPGLYSMRDVIGFG
jgi:4-hydroxy-tetrahydrodipicolinate reductase